MIKGYAYPLKKSTAFPTQDNDARVTIPTHTVSGSNFFLFAVCENVSDLKQNA